MCFYVVSSSFYDYTTIMHILKAFMIPFVSIFSPATLLSLLSIVTDCKQANSNFFFAGLFVPTVQHTYLLETLVIFSDI